MLGGLAPSFQEPLRYEVYLAWFDLLPLLFLPNPCLGTSLLPGFRHIPTHHSALKGTVAGGWVSGVNG